MKIALVLLVLGMLCIAGVSAANADFFYSDNCPHCNQIYPLVSQLSTNYNINFLNVNKGTYKIQGVPTVIIRPNDNREIVLVGSKEIPEYLECELQEMTTKECPTNSFNTERQSWFIR